MKDVLIVDGYNILHAWSDLMVLAQGSLEDARTKLLDLLADYQGYKGNEILVVFDAHLVKGGLEKRDFSGPLQVIYTASGETADMVIEKLVGDYLGKARVFVATSDYAQQRIIFGRGAYRISARELLAEVKESKKEIDDILIKGKYTSGRREIASQIDERVREVLEKWRRQSQ